MGKRQAGPGRPSKGQRHLMATRLPTDVADAVRGLAEARDWSYSDTLAALVVLGLDRVADLPPAPTQQTELPLTKAS